MFHKLLLLHITYVLAHPSYGKEKRLGIRSFPLLRDCTGLYGIIMVLWERKYKAPNEMIMKDGINSKCMQVLSSLLW